LPKKKEKGDSYGPVYMKDQKTLGKWEFILRKEKKSHQIVQGY
jgi:hypothetical protein